MLQHQIAQASGLVANGVQMASTCACLMCALLSALLWVHGHLEDTYMGEVVVCRMHAREQKVLVWQVE
jgi:hypothetical protein